MTAPKGEKASVSAVAPSEWDVSAETRLFSLLLRYKPLGTTRPLQLALITDLMNNIYDDEEEVDFEEFLKPEDLLELTSKDRSEAPRSYSPRYAIRPTVKDVAAKLDAIYNMDMIEEDELLLNKLMEKLDFDLSGDDFGESPQKEVDLSKELFITPQKIGSRASSRRNRQMSGHSPRSSTPTSAKEASKM